MADERLVVPDFATVGEFKNWVDNLSVRAIRKWTAADWVAFYKKIEPLSAEWYSSPHKMMTSCTEEFIKLNSNYRLEPKQLEYIREIARQAGEQLTRQEVDAAKLAFKTTNTDLANSANRNSIVRNMIEKVDKIAAESTEYLPEHRLQTMSIIDEEMGKTYGVASMKREKGLASIRVNTASAVDNTIHVSAHEAAHVHFQTGNPLQIELLQKKILAHPKLGEDFAALMMYNNKFYLDSKTIDNWFTDHYIGSRDSWVIQFRGYSHQPVEKFSEIYGIEVERAYRQASNQISERVALKVNDYLGRTPQSVKYTPKGVEITYRAGLDENLSGKKLMKELKSKLGRPMADELDVQLLDKAGKDVKITIPQDSKFTQKFEKFLASRPEAEAVADLIAKKPSFAQYSDSEIKLMFPKSEITEKEIHLLNKMEQLTGSVVIIDKAGKKNVFTTVTLPRDDKFFAKVEKAGNTSKFKKTVRKIDKAIDNAIEDCGEKLNNSKVGKAYASAKKKIADSTVVKKTKEIATQTKDAVVKTAKKVNQSAPVKAVKSAVKSTGKAIARTAPAKAVKQTGKAIAQSAVGQTVKKAVAKTAANTTAKAVGKSLLKKIPLISIGAGLIFGAQRAMAGDFVGAAGEVASGVCGTFPGPGTAASVTIDVGLAGRDIYKELNAPQDKTKVQVKADAEKAHKYEQQKQRQLSLTSAKTKDKTAQKQATASKMKTNAANANKYQKQMEDLLNKMNKANGKAKAVDVKKTIATLHQKYGDNAYALLKEAVQSPGKYADAVKDANIKTSRNAVQHLCDGKVNKQMMQKILKEREK